MSLQMDYPIAYFTECLLSLSLLVVQWERISQLFERLACNLTYFRECLQECLPLSAALSQRLFGGLTGQPVSSRGPQLVVHLRYHTAGHIQTPSALARQAQLMVRLHNDTDRHRR